jgi:hypothetical protein
VEEGGFEELGGDFAAGDDVFRGVANDCVGGLDDGGGLVFFTLMKLAVIESDNDQAIRFQLVGCRGG